MPSLLLPDLHLVQSLQIGNNPASSLPVAPQGRKVERVWTVVDEEALQDKGPCFETARLEMPSSVWRQNSDGSLTFRPRGAPTGEVKVVLDYETALERARRLQPPLFDPAVHVLHRITAGNHHRNTIPEAPTGRMLERIWTVVDEDLLKQIGPSRGPGRNSAFPEDRNHDWVINADGTLRFFSRVVETDQEVVIVLDYQTAAELDERMKIPRFDPDTGKPLGAPSLAAEPSVEDLPKAPKASRSRPRG